MKLEPSNDKCNDISLGQAYRVSIIKRREKKMVTYPRRIYESTFVGWNFVMRHTVSREKP